MTSPRIQLLTPDAAMADAWHGAFAALGSRPEVLQMTVEEALAVGPELGMLVSPGNGLGLMDGGIDGAYREMLGASVEAGVMDEIAGREGAWLPVGSCVSVPVDHPRVRLLICAPTMRVPSRIAHGDPAVFDATLAAIHHAMRAGLECPVTFPGMGTGTGRVPPAEAAAQMALAWALRSAPKPRERRSAVELWGLVRAAMEGRVDRAMTDTYVERRGAAPCTK